MLTRLLSLYCSVALLSLSACKKEKNPLDTLPEATQTGAGTVGWLQDGQAYQPSTNSFNGRPFNVTRFSDGDIMIGISHGTSKRNRHIVLNIRRVRAPGRYELNQVARPSFPNTTPAYGYYETSNPEPKGQYLTGPAATGHLLITRFDSVAKIVSGTFDFTAQKVQGEGPETVQITDGRFDLEYKP